MGSQGAPLVQVSAVRARRIARFAARQTRRLAPHKKSDAWLLLLLLLLGWGVGSAVLSVNGIYNLFRLLQLRPVYWLSYVTVAMAALTANISGGVCKVLGRFVGHWLPGCQRRCDCAA